MVGWGGREVLDLWILDLWIFWMAWGGDPPALYNVSRDGCSVPVCKRGLFEYGDWVQRPRMYFDSPSVAKKSM